MKTTCFTSSLFELDPRLLEWEHYAIDVQARTGMDIALGLGRVAMDYARVLRVPRYDEDTRESDVEHSYMVALFGVEFAARYFPHMDLGKIALRLLAHDLIELETGDVATFTLTQPELDTKAAQEHAAREALAKRLTPTWQAEVDGHEDQIDEEAVFCKHVEKLAPLIVDILGPGEKVMTEDFGIQSCQALADAEAAFAARMTTLFPDPSHDIIHAVRHHLATAFQQKFTDCIGEIA